MRKVLFSVLILIVVLGVACKPTEILELLPTPTPTITPTPTPTSTPTNGSTEELGQLPYYTLPQYTWTGIGCTGECGRLDGILEELCYQRRWNSLYERNQFDCSEMSAYLEAYLESKGFNTHILVAEITGRDWVGNVVGFFYNDKLYHAWVAVKLDSKYVAVESTTPSITSFYGDYKYQMIFDSYQSAEADWPSEFDYWNSPQVSQLAPLPMPTLPP